MTAFINFVKKSLTFLYISVRQSIICLPKTIKKVFGILKSFLIVSKKPESSVSANDLSEYYSNTGFSAQKGHYLNPVEWDLSIIVPIFNAQSFIRECLDSILQQITRFSFEVIIVDDGSTDDTLRIVKEKYSDERIVIFEQSNKGQSAARNNGLDHSKGKYLMVVDADDILLPNAIESLMNAAVSTNSDIAEGCVVRFYDSITDEMINDSIGKNRIESNKNNPRFVLTTYGYSVAKVYKRELWTTLRYPEGYIFEDVISKFILRRKANQVAFIEDVVYGYRMNNPNSTSHGTNKMKKLDSIWVLPKVFDLCEQEQAPRDDVFYLLSLNHIGLLNYITTRAHDMDVRLACFAEMRKQLTSIQDCRPKHMPLMFKLLDRAILENKFDAWEYIAGTINKYGMLKKWREIN